jgi:hypothetical protein
VTDYLRLRQTSVADGQATPFPVCHFFDMLLGADGTSVLPGNKQMPASRGHFVLHVCHFDSLGEPFR